MVLDIRLREIAGKSAGTYFIVTDSSGVPELEQSSNLRLFFINTEKGPVNTIVVFQRGDAAGFQSIFGKRMRKNEKQGNFSIRTCLEALTSGPIAVINLRVFNEMDVVSVNGINPNKTLLETKTAEYTKLFNTNGLWSIKPKNISGILTNEHLLNFGNVGNSPVSFFVTVSTNERVNQLTNDGDVTLLSTQLEIEEYPALDPNMLLKDTFVDVWCFKNTFGVGSSTDKYFGHLFDALGNVKFDKLEALSLIPESGFVRRVTGSMIPNLKNEFDEAISIDTLVNQYFAETNIIAYINDAVLEADDYNIINTRMFGYYDLTDGDLVSTGGLLSHRLQDQSAKFDSVAMNAILDVKLVNLTETKNIIAFTGTPETSIFPELDKNNKVFGIYECGVRVGDTILDADGVAVTVESIEIVEENSTVGMVVDEEGTYTRVILTLSDNIKRVVGANKYIYVADLLREGIVAPTNLSSYTVRVEQFTNGSASRQNEILDMMLSPGIVKGIKNFGNVRYIVDCFKSFIEGGYKYQFGQLAVALDNSNRFVRAILNEPFLEDLENSLNPLFKQSPSHSFDLSYLPQGGNPNYSTIFLTKFATGAEMAFFFPSVMDGNDEVPSVGQISGLFIQKTFQYDVVANATGYLNTVDGLPINPDDIERGYMEKFKWNPIIKTNKGFTIYGNSTAQKGNTALSQIHNSELLAFIKESLYNLSVDDPFKKGTYNEYLTTETEITSFMNDLAMSGGIQPNPVVICNASNNTADVSKQKIKLIHIEYYNIDSLDKVVFDLNLK